MSYKHSTSIKETMSTLQMMKYISVKQEAKKKKTKKSDNKSLKNPKYLKECTYFANLQVKSLKNGAKQIIPDGA